MKKRGGQGNHNIGRDRPEFQIIVKEKDGSEERRLVLRWKHLIYVNADGPNVLSVTINDK